MEIYQYVANSILGIDQDERFLYTAKIKIPEFAVLKGDVVQSEDFYSSSHFQIETLDIKFHEGKFTRFKLKLRYLPANGVNASPVSINLLFHSELMQIRRYVIHQGKKKYIESTPDKSDISLDKLEEEFNHFRKIGLFLGEQLEKIGVENHR
ncbi:hypothetical protein LFYK43_21860 [Ligilactobacillus salitolerans]|uniref:Uncharacterized protein n=1 Tax=Ligilactobacillus salitolerans TaxID=1808352 RepID=A0A401IW56_9LACO|nr:hypothetical protein [Ligilactobacillus salitolerans]GBG95727.1 hypothetical protein LFYK43_21860 [Ligilactobacillus salitolerans]